MNTLLNKILNYESKTFDEYLLKRSQLIQHIKQLNVNELTQDQLMIFINDLKDIIDPIKTSISSIDYFFTNETFDKTDSIRSNDLFKKAMIYFFLFGDSSEESEILLRSLSDSSE
jgi:hypothetical protein